QPVDSPIGLVVAAAVREKAEHEVEQRPERVVAVARVVAGEVLLADVDRREADVARRRELCRAGLLRGGPAAPAEPQPALLLKRSHQPDRKTTGRLAASRNGNSIRDGDQPAHRSSLIVSVLISLLPTEPAGAAAAANHETRRSAGIARQPLRRSRCASSLRSAASRSARSGASATGLVLPGAATATGSLAGKVISSASSSTWSSVSGVFSIIRLYSPRAGSDRGTAAHMPARARRAHHYHRRRYLDASCSSQPSTASTPGRRQRAIVGPSPTLTDTPPSAFTARKPASSVTSSPMKTGVRPANGGSAMN